MYKLRTVVIIAFFMFSGIKLEAASAARDEIHNLRNRFSMVIGFFEIIEGLENVAESLRAELAELAESLKPDSKSIHDGTNYILSLLSTLTAYETHKLVVSDPENLAFLAMIKAELSSASPKGEESKVELSSFLKRLFEVNKPQFDAKGIPFDFMSSLEGELAVYVDTTSLGDAVNNLLSNAASIYSEREEGEEVGERGRTTLRAELLSYSKDSLEVRIVVEDSGPGFSPKLEVSRLFQRGYTVRDKSHGTGLGLVQVKEFADRYSGSVIAENKERGHGAVFGFIIKLKHGFKAFSSAQNEG